MNILISNPYQSSAGGTEERIRALGNEYLKHGHKITYMIHGEPGSGQRTKDFLVYRTTANMSQKIASEIIKADKIDLVQQHNYQYVGLGAIQAAKKYGIPSVYYAHDFCSICMRRFMTDGTAQDSELCQIADPMKCQTCVSPYNLNIQLAEEEILQQATIGISPSKYFTTKLEAHNILKGKWHQITPWISPLYRDLVWSGTLNHSILFAGNLTPGKGVFTLIRALKKVLKEIPDVTLRLAAGGPKEPIVLEAKKQKVAENVLFLDVLPSDRLAMEYVNAGVVCFPSRLPEAFGLVWAEAMTVGAPVIVSVVGSIPEYASGHIPILKPDDADAWAEAILTIFQDRQTAVAVAEEAQKYAVETFSVDRAYHDIISIYEGLMKK
jgi:glycosyltransferase involved in cell wall biosynthesis